MRSSIFISSLLVLLQAGCLSIAAQNKDTLHFSLTEAMLYAIENNLNAENSRLEVEKADQRV